MEGKLPGKKIATGAQEAPPYGNDSIEHRKGERRKCNCKGFTYITMVGWMCRREQARRERDKIK